MRLHRRGDEGACRSENEDTGNGTSLRVQQQIKETFEQGDSSF
jgi:hypothetical protein